MPVRFSLAAIETAKENLDALPPAAKETREVGLREAIRALAPAIRKLVRRGYSRTKVVELLKEQGVNVSRSTFKQYFREKAVPVGEGGGQPEAMAGRPKGRAVGDGTLPPTPKVLRRQAPL